MTNANPAATSVREFFPLITRLAQQIKMPIVIVDTETTGIAAFDAVGLVDYATLTIAPTGAVSSFSTLVNPKMPIQPGAVKTHGLRSADVAGAGEFPTIYDGLTRVFQSGLVCGFNTRQYDIPVLLGNMARYGLAVMNPRAQMDVRDIWAHVTGQPNGNLAELAASYGIEPGKAHRAAGDVLTTARILEAMLWRHGSDMALNEIIRTEYPYVEPQKAVATAAGSGSGSDQIRRGKKDRAAKPTSDQVTSFVAKCVADHGRATGEDLVAFASNNGFSDSDVSFLVGDLLKSAELKQEHLICERQQGILTVHLPGAIAAVGAGKLKPLREHILAASGGQAIDYTQLRIALTNIDLF